MDIILNKEGTEIISSILHKYLGANQFLYSSLINNELWFSNPGDFNDPYDCNIHYDLSDINFNKIYKHLKT